MSKVILYVAASLDGFIANSDGDVSWLDPFNTLDYGFKSFEQSMGALIMGSKTYEKSLTFGVWPHPGKPCLIVTKRIFAQPPDTAIVFTNDSPKEVVAHARTLAHGKDIWLVGGGELVASFLKGKLLDEIQLFTMPLLLGNGVPLFPNGVEHIELTLSSTKSFPNGVIESRYEA